MTDIFKHRRKRGRAFKISLMLETPILPNDRYGDGVGYGVIGDFSGVGGGQHYRRNNQDMSRTANIEY
jgi:hypothetical protein